MKCIALSNMIVNIVQTFTAQTAAKKFIGNYCVQSLMFVLIDKNPALDLQCHAPFYVSYLYNLDSFASSAYQILIHST